MGKDNEFKTPGKETASGSFYHNTMKKFPKDADKPKPHDGKSSHQFGRFAPPQYDLSAEEIDKIKRRNEIRRNLKDEFNRKYYDPYRFLNHSELHDPRVERFMAMRATMYEYWKPTWGSFFKFYGFTLFPMLLAGWWFTKRKRKHDQMCRDNIIPYELRRYKLIV